MLDSSPFQGWTEIGDFRAEKLDCGWFAIYEKRDNVFVRFATVANARSGEEAISLACNRHA